MNRILTRAFLGLLISNSANAIVITTPTGLNPGDQYRLAFVTSATRDATSTDIADYNAFVTGVANAVPELVALGTTWTAIGSTATVDARDNTGTNPLSPGVPIYLLNDTKLADNNADLWDGSTDNALNVNEVGGFSGGTWVWTGTNQDGTSDPVFHLGSADLIVVRGAEQVATATVDSIEPDLCTPGCNTEPLSIYAMSGVITATVPLPGAALLFGSALGLLGVARKRDRQSATV